MPRRCRYKRPGHRRRPCITLPTVTPLSRSSLTGALPTGALPTGALPTGALLTGALKIGPLLIIALLAINTAQVACAADQPGIRLFREKIEPILKQHCYACHSEAAESVEAGLKLDGRETLRRGGDSGPVVDLQDSANSLLLQALRHQNGLEMPPEKPPLPDEVVADFRRWVELGAPDPRAAEPAPKASLAAARRHWAFQPIIPTAPPGVGNPHWLRSPLDAFILSRLEQQGWQPSPESSRRAWIRRVYFDLIGLPPSPEEIVAFEQDKSPDAYEQLVDRLLASPRYGERFGQLWLDVVRYAETEGFEYDRQLPGAWRFRDYVIRSLNRDKPYDRFLTEQIAGDEIGPDDPECQVAAVFHRLGPVRRNAGNPDIALSRNEVLTERTNIIGEAFLGLTVGCARCHNHKLEPISQQDYYRLQAFFAATEEHNIVLATDEQQKIWEDATERVKQQIESLQSRAMQVRGDALTKVTAEIEALQDALPPPLPTIPSIRNDAAHRSPIHVLRRGVWENKGLAVGPRPPEILTEENQAELPADLPRPRSELAHWLTNPTHPLTARVLVNRIWQHHFGQGLVRTANDFGTHGDPPSHPELLDWLAAELLDNGWRIKPLHRQIVLSSTYRQSSDMPPSPREVAVGNVPSEAPTVSNPAFDPATEPTTADPDNRLLWRFARRRLSAEEIRDAMLLVSGRLNARMGGPSVLLPVDPELVRLLYKPAQWQVTADPLEHERRSIYLVAKRNLRLPFLETFDGPALLTSCPRRETSTHAPQALELLNGAFSNAMAVALANRLTGECGADRTAIVERAFWLALGRPPTAQERKLSLEFLDEQPVSEFALAVFNLNGFVYAP
jgi:hypothetical protein